MLCLWIFGAAVEGRLGSLKYFAMYMLAGIVGSLCQTFIFGRNEPDVPGLGASGAIMGAMGSYLYMFPFSNVKVFYWLFIRIGVFECQALWVLGFFMIDNLIGIGMRDNVGHFAHLGGFVVGYLFALATRSYTDSGAASEVKSMLSEVKDLHILHMHELEVLLAAPQTDSKVLMAYCTRAQMDGGDRWAGMVVSAMQRHQKLVLEDADPRMVSGFLLALGPNDPNLLPLVYLRIGSKLEQIHEYDLSCHIYRRIYDMNPSSRDAETALYRMGRLLETIYTNPEEALKTYQQLLMLHPHGALRLDTEAAVSRLTTKPKREVPDHFIYSAPNVRRVIEFDDTVHTAPETEPEKISRQAYSNKSTVDEKVNEYIQNPVLDNR
jgi:hypothetical protein